MVAADVNAAVSENLAVLVGGNVVADLQDDGARLGENASFETFLENLEMISDMSKAEDGVARRQRQRAQRTS